MNRSSRSYILTILAVFVFSACSLAAEFKVHGIFSSNMVLQREKPIKVWGWAPKGQEVTVTFGKETASGKADGEDGMWEVTFPAQKASSKPQKLTVKCGKKKIIMKNIVIGDVWVMNGQSNMAFGLGKTLEADMETLQANLPLLRYVKISANEQTTLQKDISSEKLSNGGWVASDPQTAGGLSAIGYNFACRLQRALQIPIGVIDNARGGASIESLVPLHKFDDDPIAKAYKKHLDKRIAEFDAKKVIDDMWEKQLERARKKGTPEDKLPKRPTLRSWNIPGMSPSDAGSCYNGMFGVFKGLNIKGVLFHQGYNNAMGSNCRPKRYRVLMRLMVEGWREDFNDPALPVGVIGLCAGGIPQTRDNFEVWSNSTQGYIREAQRLGLADVKAPDNTAYMPGHDVQIPGLHPQKKQAHGIRAARWALSKVYDQRVNWDRAQLLSAKPEGNRILLTFDKPVFPDNKSMALEGFSIADKSGKFYMAHAESPLKKDVGIWNTSGKSTDATKIYVSSPLVKEPVAVRYAWAASPMGNLKVNGKPWLPLQNFRTDKWDWPEGGPDENVVDRVKSRAMSTEAAERCEYRKAQELKLACEALKANSQIDDDDEDEEDDDD